MSEIREYLVRTPDGYDYGRDAELTDCVAAAETLGAGAIVVALDDFLLPIRELNADGELVVKVVYEVA